MYDRIRDRTRQKKVGRLGTFKIKRKEGDRRDGTRQAMRGEKNKTRSGISIGISEYQMEYYRVRTTRKEKK